MEIGSESALTAEQIERAEQYRRRRATAVLCPVFGDVVASTALLEEFGELVYGDVAEAHDRAVREVVERDSAGAVLKTSGDGFLAVFSEPSTAVERCLEIQSRLAGSRLRLRIGIDMGQVAIKRASGIVADIFGRHVNRASRIESLAKPGCVLTSFPVYDSSVGWLRGVVEWAHHPPVQLRGFADQISLHEPALHVLLDAPSGSPITGTAPRWMSRSQSVSARAAPRHHAARPRREASSVDQSQILLSGKTTRETSDDPLEDALRLIRSSPRPRVLRAFAKRRILWVDDAPDRKRELRALLSDAGLRIECALGTSEALSALQRRRFAAVVSDMRRGQNSNAGLELLERVRAANIRVPSLIFTSPELEAEHAEDAISLGARICTSGVVSLLRCLGDALCGR
jgi:class 3 adenylate cyclase/CheY-like chemotaxis protein